MILSNTEFAALFFSGQGVQNTYHKYKYINCDKQKPWPVIMADMLTNCIKMIQAEFSFWFQ